MKLRLLLVLMFTALMGTNAFAAGKGGYQVVHGWPLLPEGRVLGSAAGVAVNARGEVFVFHRAGRVWSEPLPTEPMAEPTIAVFDSRTGRLLREIGAGLFAMPHGLSVDPDGNLWATDVALQQIFKLSPDGRVLLTLGTRAEPGADGQHFNRPTQVGFAHDGTILIADGYRNTRVARFSADGRFLGQWGTPGKAPGEFNTPHAIAIDAAGKVYVADRQNDRVQVFDPQGKLLAIWASPQIGRPYGIALLGPNRFAIADGGEQPKAGPDRSALVIVDGKGQVIERIGRYGNQDGQFRMAHHLATGADGAVYVVDITGQRVQKFVRQ
ncbi:MAG: peptidyl-alpha-hydroxyglycine alpha-amidating lyase family protein [Sphingomonadales bacterium]|jgi:peptidylamidoglycolate lyase